MAVVGKGFKKVSLSDYKGKYLILFFYPLDFTFVCPTEIIAFSERVEEFRKIGADVAVVAAYTGAVFSRFSHLAWINSPWAKQTQKVPILADTNHAISKAYGVFKEDEGIAYRGLFIISPDGVIRQITINDLSVDASAVLHSLRDLRDEIGRASCRERV